MIAVYAVKLNLDSEDPQEVATFDESKAEALRVVFLDMHELSLMSETHTSYVTRQETDDRRMVNNLLYHKCPIISRGRGSLNEFRQ